MTGRERLQNILNHRPVDHLSWTTLVDDRTRSAMPRHVRETTPLEFYRRIGCDVMQFGNYSLPPDLVVRSPAELVTPCVQTESRTEPHGVHVQTRTTEWGPLTLKTREAHAVKYPVESVEELRTLKNVWRESHYAETEGMEEDYERLETATGEHGVYVPTVPASPVQQLLQVEMGVENFYFLLQDYPSEVEELISIMHARRVVEYDILARRTPAEAVIPVENTSSTLVSPAIYRRYSLPQIRDYVEIAHKYNKKAILHMCGLLKSLLPVLSKTGLDGINGLTPPPVGDTTFEDALDALGEDLIVLGGILDSSVFQAPRFSLEELRSALDQIYTPRIRKANFLLWLPADGLPTPLERFLAVRDWMDEKGAL